MVNILTYCRQSWGQVTNVQVSSPYHQVSSKSQATVQTNHASQVSGSPRTSQLSPTKDQVKSQYYTETIHFICLYPYLFFPSEINILTADAFRNPQWRIWKVVCAWA